MLLWPPARTEVRPWRQTSRGGVAADRRLSQISVCIPEPLGDRAIDLPSALASSIDSSTKAIAALDVSRGSSLHALSALLLRTESVASSKIEQISASMDDYARALHGSKTNAAATAMVAAIEATKRLMSQVGHDGLLGKADLLAAHERLMRDDPFEKSTAGQLREVQNWVGGSDYSPRGALLIPPPPERVEDLFNDIVQFANRRDLPALVQAAIAHAQFETLHPFTDGNGRIGRALINAILRVRGATTRTLIPLTSALVARREEYFDALNEYRKGNLEPLLSSFAIAARIAAEESATTADRLSELPGQWRSRVSNLRKGSATDRLLDFVLAEPVISAEQAQQHLGTVASGTYLAIDRLVEAEVLRPLTDRKRNQVWGASALLYELDDLSQRIEARSAKAQP